MKAYLIIVNWNGEKFIGNCLKSLENQSYKNMRIIVVDNGSKDSSLNIIKKYKNIKLIKLDKNTGFAEGNNVGIRYAMKDIETKYIAIINNDTTADKNWLKNGIKAIEETKSGICACNIRLMKDRHKLDSAGVKFYTNFMPDAIGQHELITKYTDRKYVFGCHGAAAIFTREMLESIKIDDWYFDPDYFCYQEEFDLNWRSQLQGFKCIYEPKSTVYHYGSGTAEHMSTFAKYHLERNRVWTMAKNIDTRLFIKYIKDIIMYEVGSMLFYLIKKDFYVVLKSRFDAIMKINTALKKRNRIKRKVNSKYIESLMEKRNYLESFKRNV